MRQLMLIVVIALSAARLSAQDSLRLSTQHGVGVGLSVKDSVRAHLFARDSVRVLCLYGSVPAKGWKGVEPQFRKGMFTRLINLRGGHVGVETGASAANGTKTNGR